MNRAERRRIAKSKEKKAVYTYTEEQLKVLVDSLVKMKVEQEKDAIAQEISAQILALLFVLPMEVLMDFTGLKVMLKRFQSLLSTFWIIMPSGKTGNLTWTR